MISLSYERVEQLRQTHPALKLLNADSQALVISFLYQAFIKPNRRTVSFIQLSAELEDYLFILRERYGLEKFPKKASQYLNDWTQENAGYLRKYYVANQDEPECDITPEVEKAFEWLQSLEQKEFIGTESRLLMLFQLLRDVVYYTEEDTAARVKALEKKKIEIENELALAKSGIINGYDSREIKERFLQAEELARRLLSDFRQVEQNFRLLDRETREQIAVSDKTKGEILDSIFVKHDAIRGSDQGKSFRAFWEFLMSPERQDELKNLLVHLYQLKEVRELASSEFLAKIHIDLLQAGEKVYLTASALSEQLRRFLDNRAYLENKRLMTIIQKIERKIIQHKEIYADQKDFTSLHDVKPVLRFLLARALFSIPKKIVIKSDGFIEGQADVTLDALYLVHYIDVELLRQNIQQVLQNHLQITLRELLQLFPLQKGLAELMTYIKLASELPKTIIDEEKTEEIVFSSQGMEKQVKLPLVIFSR